MQASDAASGRAGPRDDVVGGTLWVALGIAIAIGSWRMDRLASQGVNPVTVPGLVPGLLGLAMIFFGGLMLIRGARHGGLGMAASTRTSPAQIVRIATIIALCVLYAGALVGHGLPFWLASALFVAVSITVLRWRELAAAGTLPRGIAQAVAIGLGAGVAISFVFERFFLVRLP